MMLLPIQGHSLLLREFDDKDIPSIIRIVATPDFNFYALPPSTSSKAEIEDSAVRFVYRMKESNQIDPVTHVRESYKLAVAEATNPEQLVGYVALDEISEYRGEKRDVGYFTAPAMQGKGYATLASILLLERFYAATTYDLVHATVHPENIASRKILKKLGYRENGSITKMVRGIIEPRIVLSLHRNDFLGAIEPLRNKTTGQNFVKLPSQKGALDNV